MNGISLDRMEKEVRFMNGGDISISNDLGNVIELNDINDSLGLNMLTNMKVSSNSSGDLAEINIDKLPEPAMSFNLNETSFPPLQAEIRREDIYSNNQIGRAHV